MGNKKRFYWLILSIVVLSGLYFLVRPQWRLPFDVRSPFEAILVVDGMALGIPTEKWTSQHWAEKPWMHDGELLYNAFSVLELNQGQFKNFWLLPNDNNGDLVFTFIAESNKNLSRFWNTMELGGASEFEGVKYFGWPQDSSPELYLCQLDNLILAGRFPFQVETAIAAILEGDNWYGDDGFDQLQNQQKNQNTADFQLIINGSTWQNAWKEEWTQDRKLLNFTKDLTWAQLDISFQDSSCIWKGWGITKNGLDQTYTGDDFTALPQIVSWATESIADDIDANADFNKFILPWAGKSTIKGALPVGINVIPEMGDFWIMAVQDTAALRSGMAMLDDERGISDRLLYQSYVLQQCISPSLLQPHSDRKGLHPWWVQLEDKVVFAVSAEVLKRIVDYHLSNATLMSDEDFLKGLQLEPSFIAEGQRSLFKTSARAPSFAHFFTQLFPEVEWLKSAMLLQHKSVSSPNEFQFTGVAVPQKQQANMPFLDWTIELDDLQEFRLLPMLLAQSGQVFGVMAQDTSGNCQAIAANGDLLFHTQTAKNLHTVFVVNTAEGDRIVGVSEAGLHVWDFNGNPTFPFTALSGQTSQATPIMIDFDNDENWQLFFSDTITKSIRAINLYGEYLPEWTEETTKLESVKSLTHIELAEEDLIIRVSKKGQWNAWDRNGQLQFSIPQKDDTPIISPVFYQKNLSGDLLRYNRAVIAHASGEIQVVNFSGEHFRLPLGRGPLDHFLLVNGWGDERADYLAQRGNLVHLFAYQGEDFTERWQFRLPEYADTMIAGGSFGNFVLINSRQQIYAVDYEGQAISGFPLAGEGAIIPILDDNQLKGLITSVGQTVYGYGWD